MMPFGHKDHPLCGGEIGTREEALVYAAKVGAAPKASSKCGRG